MREGDRMGKITGNKGEWSEMYAFLRILVSKRIYGADGDTEKRNDVYYDVNRIIRDEGNGEVDYSISDDGMYAEVRSGDKVLVRIVKDKVAEESEFLLDAIRTSKGRSFSVDRTEELMNELRCTKIKAPSKDKSDITIEIHDYRTGMDPVLGFSIKSALGHPSTLLNSGKTTNFIFKLDGNVTEERISIVNGTAGYSASAEHHARKTLGMRYQTLLSAGITLNYMNTESQVMSENLMLIDSRLPEIVAEMLKIHYIDGVSCIEKQIDILSEKNPLGLSNADKKTFYGYKVRKLLAAFALGMQPATPWKGNEDASGGYIVVKQDGEVLCYHLYNRNDFEDYLVKHTKLETASTSRHDFSKIYKDVNGDYMLKLNLQIRFV